MPELACLTHKIDQPAMQTSLMNPGNSAFRTDVFDKILLGYFRSPHIYLN